MPTIEVNATPAEVMERTLKIIKDPAETEERKDTAAWLYFIAWSATDKVLTIEREDGVLTGDKKKTYQRNYMREYMKVKRGKANKQVVKTLNIKPVKTQIDADGNVIYTES